jgi:hypothetical protein
MTKAFGKAYQKVSFQLTPFHKETNQDISITGSVSLFSGELHIQYSLHQAAQGNSSPVLWPSAKQTVSRCDGIWQSTCMELFISSPSMQRYWEYNFCPSGDWNIYQLSDYRSTLQVEPSCRQPAITYCQKPGVWELDVVTQLPNPLIDQPVLILAITAVVKQQNGELSYWALHHGGGEADFHRRDGFQLSLVQPDGASINQTR